MEIGGGVYVLSISPSLNIKGLVLINLSILS
jgi:hypothetical protein